MVKRLYSPGASGTPLSRRIFWGSSISNLMLHIWILPPESRTQVSIIKQNQYLYSPTIPYEKYTCIKTHMWNTCGSHVNLEQSHVIHMKQSHVIHMYSHVNHIYSHVKHMWLFQIHMWTTCVSHVYFS